MKSIPILCRLLIGLVRLCEGLLLLWRRLLEGRMRWGVCLLLWLERGRERPLNKSMGLWGLLLLGISRLRLWLLLVLRLLLV